MAKSRILWGLELILCVLFYVFTDSYAGLWLLAISLVLPIVEMIGAEICAKKLFGTLGIDNLGEKQKDMTAMLKIKNTGLFPFDRIIAKIKCENLLTGEAEEYEILASAPAKTETLQQLQLKSRHCGKLCLSLEGFLVLDYFGLRKTKIPAASQKMTLITPNTFGLQVEVVYGENAVLDAEEYSMSKAGFDPSETFAVREYRAGDHIHQIHWKLSEKLDGLIVRDYGLPVQNTILLLLETGYPEKSEEFPSQMEKLVECLVSVSQEMCEQQIVHSIGWYNHKEQTYSSAEIDSLEEFTMILPELLSAVPGEDGTSVLGHYMEQREQCEFAHLVLFTPYLTADASALAERCLVTEVICEKEPRGEFTEEGAHVISVSTENAEAELSYLEI